MAAKTQTIGDLKKMNAKDLIGLLNKSLAELSHLKLHVKSGEDKQSHRITELKKMIAQINTLNHSQENA